MKQFFTACAVAVAAFAAVPAFAQGYIGGGFGSSRVTGLDFGTISGGNTSKGLVKIYGGYQFTPNWGAEAQYSDLGNRNLRDSSNNQTASFKTSQFSIAGTGTLPLSSGFSLLGKLGVSGNRVTGTPNLGNYASTSALVGVGVGYTITPNWSARLEYEDFGKVTTVIPTGSTVRANAYSLSVKYAF